MRLQGFIHEVQGQWERALREYLQVYHGGIFPCVQFTTVRVASLRVIGCFTRLQDWAGFADWLQTVVRLQAIAKESHRREKESALREVTKKDSKGRVLPPLPPAPPPPQALPLSAPGGLQTVCSRVTLPPNRFSEHQPMPGQPPGLQPLDSPCQY